MNMHPVIESDWIKEISIQISYSWNRIMQNFFLLISIAVFDKSYSKVPVKENGFQWYILGNRRLFFRGFTTFHSIIDGVFFA